MASTGSATPPPCPISTPDPVLTLRFSPQPGRVQLTCDAELAPALQRLRLQYATGAGQGPQSIDIGIDDFLVNLYELANWPDDAFDWQPELLTLVQTNAADAALVAERLANPAAAPADFAALGGGWAASLTEFQLRDLGKLAELSHGANFSVPGAGKTRVSLAVFQARRDAGRVQRMLVVSPKSAFESWLNEAEACYPSNQPRVRVMDTSAVPAADVVLVNYERLPDAQTALLGWLRSQPAMLVLDEAHRMKLGSAGAWGAACLALGPYATSRLILSGTPAPNGARDLENLMGFVWPGQGREAVSSAVGNNTLAEASRRLKPLFTRTTKTELNLPPFEIKRVPVELPPLHRDLYDALLGQYAGPRRVGSADPDRLGRVLLYLLMAATSPALLATGTTRYEPLNYRVPPLRPDPDSSLSSLMHDLPSYELSPKYQEAVAIVAANRAAGRKTLVWSTFVRSLTSLQALLDAYKPAMVHGGTEDRDEQLRRFRTDPDCWVLLSNPATLGEGVSLHHTCHDAVYIDRDFAAGRFLQSLDRIHRLGLTPGTQTTITVLESRGTVDELVNNRLEAKLKFMGGVLDDPTVRELGDLEEQPPTAAGLTAEDVQALLGYLRRDAAA